MAEEQSNWAACRVELAAIRSDIKELKHLIEIQNGRVRENGKQIAQNCTDIAVLSDWRRSQANPGAAEAAADRKELRQGLMDQTIEMTTLKGLVAKYGTLGGSLGAGIGIAYAIIEIVKGFVH